MGLEQEEKKTEIAETGEAEGSQDSAVDHQAPVAPEPDTHVSSLEIGPADIDFLKSYLQGKTNPLPFEEVVHQLAIYKTQENRTVRVKLYDPECEYQAGDLIYKEYPGKIPVGSKKFVELSEGVILKVQETRQRAGLHEIVLSYEGTSEYRKYIEYLHKQHIELLLPHRGATPPAEPEFLSLENDPRSNEPPLIDRDLRELRRKVISLLHRESDLVLISDRVLLNKNLRPIAETVVEKIKDFLKTGQKSESTEFFVRSFLSDKADGADFDAYCFSLNHVLLSQYKIDLLQTSTKGWGKWHLRSVLYHLKKNSLVSDPNPLLATAKYPNDKNLPARRKKFDDEIFAEGENRYFLTQREITAGAVHLRPGTLNLVGPGEIVEIVATDATSHKEYTLYFYPDAHLLIGFQEAFVLYRAVQGMMIILERTDDARLQFHIKTTKKGSVVDPVTYDPEQKLFRVGEEKAASPVFINKAMFLEAEVFRTIESHGEEFRKQETLNQLIHRVFLEFGIKERNYEIHVFRLHHILDLIYPISLRETEDVLLTNPEFIASEKVPGLFYLDSDAVVELEEEERDRRQKLIEEAKRKREDLRRRQLEEEQKQKDEIRLKREERRKKREDEMLQHDQQRRERERPRPAAPSEAPRAAVPPPEMERTPSRTAPGRRFSKPEFAAAEPPSSKPEPKKARRKVEPEKVKTVKKGQKRILEEKIELEEMKKHVLKEDLQDALAEKSTEFKKKVKEGTKVAYQDEGGFAGIFASKLDEIVKKEEPEPKKSKKKTAKK